MTQDNNFKSINLITRKNFPVAQRINKVKVNSLSLSDSVTPWTVAHQAPLSMGFSRQEYWSGLPFPSPGNLPDPGIEPRSPALQACALTSEPPGKPNGKESACNEGDPSFIPGLEDPLEKEMATFSSILAWRIPWTEEPGRLQSMGSQSWAQLSD